MDPLAPVVAARYKAALDVDLDVNKSGSEVVVQLRLKDREAWYRAHGYSRGLPSHMKKPGYVDGSIELDKVTSSIPPKCLENASELALEVFGREVPIWRVRGVLLGPKLAGKGLGKALYQKAFRAIAPAIVVSDECAGGQTSFSAARVWKSLSSKHPHRGEGLDELAIAVKG